MLAAHTLQIRVGSGGIMLPNHSSLVIAEQFGTPESLFPGQIDLGLGRAPGTDHLTAQALRRNSRSDGHDFPDQLAELRHYFCPPKAPEKKHVRAFPGEGLNTTIWLLFQVDLVRNWPPNLDCLFLLPATFHQTI
jgi:luciferase family oxidoreductase group 1